MNKIEEREQGLRNEAQPSAHRVYEWLRLLESLRSAAVAGVDPAELVEPLKSIPPDMLEKDIFYCGVLVSRGFKFELDAVTNQKQLAEARTKKKCPYTAAQYDDAVKKVGTKQELLAAELTVSRNTLRKYGRPDD